MRTSMTFGLRTGLAARFLLASTAVALQPVVVYVKRTVPHLWSASIGRHYREGAQENDTTFIL